LQQYSVSMSVVDAIATVVSYEDNMFLTAPFQEQEFKEAMFSMHPDKCPSPDGLNPGFFQHFWSISKAYDRVDWLYLKEVMLKIGFASQWVCWILICIETIDYSVILNNEMV